MPESVSPICTRFHRAVELIGGRWTGAIIRTLLQGPTRYATVKTAIPDITDRMLSERLRSLETEDLVTRRVLPESPIRVEYELTEKGRSLQKALDEIGVWAERWIPGEAESAAPVVASHAEKTSRATKAVSQPPASLPHRGPRIRAR
jgi:DNA-binding HxlR family transcriptional regulator